MSDLGPQVPQEEDNRRRRRLGWWVWPIAALFLLVVGAGSFAADGGFSKANTGSTGGASTPTEPSGSPLISGSGGSSGGTTGGSSSTASPAVAAGGGLNLLGIPPPPVITSEPTNPTTSQTAAFTYSDAILLTSFRCSLDGSAYSQCGAVIDLPSKGAITYTNLSLAQHCFSVEGVTALLLVSNPTTYCWQVNGVGFTISWTDPTKIAPGTSQGMNLVFTNPNNKAITVPKSSDPGGLAITFTVTPVGSNTCGVSNYSVTQGLTTAVTVPANATNVSLSGLSVPSADWPVFTMWDGSGGSSSSHTNQDGCEGAHITFTFSATASGS